MARKKTKTGSITRAYCHICAKCNQFSKIEFLVGTGKHSGNVIPSLTWQQP